jgi:Protein of unknown function (DUF3078)
MKVLIKTSLLTAALLVITYSHSTAQIVKLDTLSNWKKKTSFGLNFNQASFSSNWKGGGVNSIGFNGLFNHKANFAKGKDKWDNEIDLQYGFVNNDGQGMRKTLDRIYLDTKYGRDLTTKWSMFSSLNFLSQFAPGYKYTKDANGVEVEDIISDVFAPAFITAALGFEYKPVDYFKVRISPVAPRLTIVQDPTRFTQSVAPAPYGVDSTKTTRFEWFAFQLTADFNKDIAKNINLKWRYMLFANYETLEAEKIDHRLDLLLTAKVNRFFNVNLGGVLIYDFDQDDEVQLSQLFNFGFSYSIQNYAEKKK